MENIIVSGIVKSFNGHRQYGFVRLQSSNTEVFFHFKDGERTSAAKGHSFCGGKPTRKPRQGDHIVFKLSKDKNGRMRAAPWGFFNEVRDCQTPVKRPEPRYH